MLEGMLEEKGSTSSMRVAMMLCTCTGCAVALMGTYAAMRPGATIDLIQVATLCVSLIGAGITGKVMQKGKETQNISLTQQG